MFEQGVFSIVENDAREEILALGGCVSIYLFLRGGLKNRQKGGKKNAPLSSIWRRGCVVCYGLGTRAHTCAHALTTHVHTHVHTYTNAERERERERDAHTRMCTNSPHTCAHISMHICTHA